VPCIRDADGEVAVSDRVHDVLFPCAGNPARSIFGEAEIHDHAE
jgi:hypothetical protein